jgi:hypothetical protein
VGWAYWLCSMVIAPVVVAFAFLAYTNPKGERRACPLSGMHVSAYYVQAGSTLRAHRR